MTGARPEGAPVPTGRTVSVPTVLRRVLDHLAEGVILLALDGTIVHFSTAARDLLRVPAARLDGRVHDLVDDEPAHVEALLERWAGSGQPRPGTLAFRSPEGRVELRCDGARLADPPIVVVRCRPRQQALHPFEDLAQDIEMGHLRQLKRRLEATIEELRTANRQLASANAQLERYASVVSHDLRSPLATIAGYAELLRQTHADQLDEDAHESIAAITRNAARMQQVISALLSLTRISSMAETAEPVDTGAALDDALDQLASELQAVDADVQVHRPLPTVVADRTQVTQLLQNLISNSLRFRHPDRTPRIVVSGRRVDGQAELTVIDNGIGVPPQDRERIFTPLVRGATPSDQPGTGLGLATCRRIVGVHGGTIRCDEHEGGSRFTFTLPAARPS